MYKIKRRERGPGGGGGVQKLFSMTDPRCYTVSQYKYHKRRGEKEMISLAGGV